MWEWHGVFDDAPIHDDGWPRGSTEIDSDDDDDSYTEEEWEYRDSVLLAFDYSPQLIAREWPQNDLDFWKPHGIFMWSVLAYHADFDVNHIDWSWYGDDFEWPTWPN
jgi:hypothetical protein